MRPYFALIFLTCAAFAAQPPSFTNTTSFQSLPGPLAATTGDFNGDGHIDLIISNTAVSSISILLGNGDGTFKPRVDVPVPGCQIGQTITGDFNRDGHLDLLASCTLTNTIAVLPGHGDGTFGAPILSKTPFPIVSGFLENFVNPITSADINGDGIPDLALIMQTSALLGLGSPGAIGQTITMTGNGDGTFGHITTLNIAPAGTETYAVQLADVNGDGKADIVGLAFTYDSNGLTVPLNAYLIVAPGDGKGGFHLTNSYPLTGIPQTGMVVADINADGKLDVVFNGLSISAVANSDLTDFSGIGVFLGGGDGTFTKTFAVADPQGAQNQGTIGSTLAPILGTKYPDLISLLIFEDANGVGPVTGSVVVRPNNGDGTFAQPITIAGPSPSLAFAVTAADFNGDGRSDLVVFNYTTNLLSLIFGSNVDIETQIDLIGPSMVTYPPAIVQVLMNQASTPSGPFTITNAASFKAGPVAASSIATSFGSNLASSIASAQSVPLPLTLGGASINVTDSLSVTRPAPLFYVSPGQINFEIPDGTATGKATVTIANASGHLDVQQQIVAASPGIFNASGYAVGQLQSTFSGTTTSTSIVQVNSQAQVSPIPIDVGAINQTTYLILYGTGLRTHTAPATATIGAVTITADYAGPAPGFVGEDQINIHLPQSLRHAGLVNMTLNVDGNISAPVQLSFQ